VRISLEGLVKRFGDLTVVDHVTLEIAAGELFFLLGPSGCGKTTLLRCIAGFTQPDAGRIRIGGEDVTQVPPHRRDTGMVFQSYALWPHLTVRENVAFGLEMRKVPAAERAQRVAEALALVQMTERTDFRPAQLSGGQQQRVALARALVVRPRCLLLDEPLSNLDARLRLEMRGEIRRICKEAGLTAVYVTHDQKEALSVADRIAVMERGRVAQVGTPGDLYRRPANRFVANFLGETNFLTGTVLECDGRSALVRTAAGNWTSAALPQIPPRAGDAVTLSVRPEALQIGTAVTGANHCTAQLEASVFLGEGTQHALRAGPSLLLHAYESHAPARARGGLIVSCAPEDAMLLTE
jgi:iron(III) transport system ATP-binding protein